MCVCVCVCVCVRVRVLKIRSVAYSSQIRQVNQLKFLPLTGSDSTTA